MGHDAQLNEFSKPLKFDQWVYILYFGDRVRIHHGQQRISKVDKCWPLKTPGVGTLKPRRIPLDCVSRTRTVGRELLLMGYLL